MGDGLGSCFVLCFCRFCHPIGTLAGLNCEASWTPAPACVFGALRCLLMPVKQNCGGFSRQAGRRLGGRPRKKGERSSAKLCCRVYRDLIKTEIRQQNQIRFCVLRLALDTPRQCRRVERSSPSTHRHRVGFEFQEHQPPPPLLLWLLSLRHRMRLPLQSVMMVLSSREESNWFLWELAETKRRGLGMVTSLASPPRRRPGCRRSSKSKYFGFASGVFALCSA